MVWTWDLKRNRSNRAKHRLSFEMAQRVFDDPLALSKLDEASDEERWITVGMVEGVVILLVHTWQETESGEPGGRIISARKATKREIKAYQKGS
jgi:uncharacterized DUF497 family protein